MHRKLIASLAAAAMALVLVSAASAGKKKSYFFDIDRIKLPEGTPDGVEELLAKQLAASIEGNARLVAALDEDAPNPDTDPEGFKKYLKKKNLEAFVVQVDVLDYEHKVEDQREPRTGKLLTVRIGLRMFGITVPGDTMAFSGEGSATIKLELGKKLRKRDTEVANHDAIELAVEGAIDDSIKKLDRPKAKPSGK